MKAHFKIVQVSYNDHLTLGLDETGSLYKMNYLSQPDSSELSYEWVLLIANDDDRKIQKGSSLETLGRPQD